MVVCVCVCTGWVWVWVWVRVSICICIHVCVCGCIGPAFHPLILHPLPCFPFLFQKINTENTWSLPLIDHMNHLLSEDLNFQKASCTLDASVQIYSSRVDDVWTTSFRVLENLNRSDKRNGKKNKADGDDSDSDDDGVIDELDDVSIIRPVNGGTAEISGVELAWQGSLDQVSDSWWGGFGALLNWTYVDSEQDQTGEQRQTTGVRDQQRLKGLFRDSSFS